MARSRHPRRISMKLRSLCLCTSLYMALGCSTNESAPAPGTPTANRSGASSPGFPASPIQVTTSATYAYPLKISTNRRYLVDQNNKPFRIQGDSAQSLIVNLTYARQINTSQTGRERDSIPSTSTCSRPSSPSMRQPTEMEMLLSRSPATSRHRTKLTLPLRIRSLISLRRRGCWSALRRCTSVLTAGTRAGGRC